VFVWIITKERCRSVDGTLIGIRTGGDFFSVATAEREVSFALLSSISWLLGFLLYGSFFLAAVFPDYSTLPPAQTAGLWSPVVSFSF
jgi:hypothetical protein